MTSNERTRIRWTAVLETLRFLDRSRQEGQSHERACDLLRDTAEKMLSEAEREERAEPEGPAKPDTWRLASVGRGRRAAFVRRSEEAA